MSSNRLTKDELRHDAFVDTTARVTAFLQRNFMGVLVGVAAVAVGVVVAVFIMQSRESSQVQAARSLFAVTTSYSAGQYSEALLQVEELLSRFGGTREGRAALYLAGASHLALGEHDEAIARFEEYLGAASSGTHAPAARLGLGLALEGRGDLERAVQQFQSVRTDVEPTAPVAVQAALGEARALQALGRIDDAIAVLTSLNEIEEFSSQQEIENRLATLRALR